MTKEEYEDINEDMTALLALARTEVSIATWLNYRQSMMTALTACKMQLVAEQSKEEN